MYEWLIPVIAAVSVLTLIIVVVAVIVAISVAIKVRNEYMKYCQTLKTVESIVNVSHKIADAASCILSPLQHVASSGCRVLSEVERIAVNSLKRVADRIECT